MKGITSMIDKRSHLCEKNQRVGKWCVTNLLPRRINFRGKRVAWSSWRRYSSNPASRSPSRNQRLSVGTRRQQFSKRTSAGCGIFWSLWQLMNILVTKQLPEALQLEETVMTGQVLLVLSDFYVECSWVSLQGTLNNWNPYTQTSNVMKSLKKNFRNSAWPGLLVRVFLLILE